MNKKLISVNILAKVKVEVRKLCIAIKVQNALCCINKQHRKDERIRNILKKLEGAGINVLGMLNGLSERDFARFSYNAHNANYIQGLIQLSKMGIEVDAYCIKYFDIGMVDLEHYGKLFSVLKQMLVKGFLPGTQRDDIQLIIELSKAIDRLGEHFINCAQRWVKSFAETDTKKLQQIIAIIQEENNAQKRRQAVINEILPMK